MRRFLFCLFIWFCPHVLLGAINGTPILNNDYKVDVSQSVIVGPSRMIAMGGAYTAMAEGVASVANNPAGVAFREPGSSEGWDWDAAFGSFFVTGNDFDNNGSVSSAYKKNQVMNLGASVQYGQSGFGFYGVVQKFDVGQSGRTNKFEFNQFNLVYGRSFFEKQLTFGCGFRFAAIHISPYGTTEKILDLSGAGGKLGLVWNPDRGDLRIGVSYDGPIKTDQDKTSVGSGSAAPVVVEGLVVPREATLPVVGAIGMAYEWNDTPYLKAHPFVLSGEVRVIGKLTDAYGIESFLEQKIQKSGEKLTPSFHVGAEFEALPGRCRVRLGTYHEPSRFEGASARQHATGGFQYRLFKFHFYGERHLSLSYAFDIAQRYVNNFVSIGLWCY